MKKTDGGRESKEAGPRGPGIVKLRVRKGDRSQPEPEDWEDGGHSEV